MFENWMKQVDAALIKLCGITHDDLPDFCYRDAFDCGEEAADVAQEAFEAAHE